MPVIYIEMFYKMQKFKENYHRLNLDIQGRKELKWINLIEINNYGIYRQRAQFNQQDVQLKNKSNKLIPNEKGN